MTLLTSGKKECFVIMPFGDKKDAEGKIIDFNEIYTHLIKNTVEALEDLQMTCIRCDEIAEAGWIHDKMFQHVYESDVAVVDITSLNPNVFYELGIRHSLAGSVTVLIRRKGTEIPFNIQGLNVIEYDPGSLASIDEAKKKIADYIRNGLKSRKNDSPVHQILDLGIRAVPKELTKTEIFSYQINGAPNKQVRLITGDIRRIKGVDVWVNSENSNMQMARYFDRSISSVIRYCGARKVGGRVVEDSIARELISIVGENASVSPGEVIATGSGELERTHGVKKIFHAAAVFGQAGPGYTPIADVAICVRNALELADSSEFDDIELKSMLFPLLGTGTGRGEVEGKAHELIGAAISHLAQDPHCKIDHVYFVVLTERDFNICQQILRETPEVTAI
ncbi:MAG: macro domain-containing protein [Actinobacteria bacterium]|nr:macro domain-containing protein [Actinomycetota bacterium]